MHDCYQQQNPLNEAPLNGNTIIPPGAQGRKARLYFLAIVMSAQWEASLPPQRVKVREQRATLDGHVGDKTGTGAQSFHMD